MPKLHELLAVETDLDSSYKKIVEEATGTFRNRTEHFNGFQKTLKMFDESKANEETSDYKEMVTTVDDKLEYVSEFIIKYFDAIYQKENSNQKACADLIVDGNIIAKNVPATFLLSMENKLKNIRAMYDEIPTLSPGIKWVINETLGKGVYETYHPEVAFKTAKTFKSQIIAPATDKHQAVVEKWDEQVPVGKYITTRVSGMLTPARKSILIGRIDKLMQACKQARQRANCVDVENKTIGKELLTYINNE